MKSVLWDFGVHINRKEYRVEAEDPQEAADIAAVFAGVRVPTCATVEMPFSKRVGSEWLSWNGYAIQSCLVGP